MKKECEMFMCKEPSFRNFKDSPGSLLTLCFKHYKELLIERDGEESALSELESEYANEKKE